MRRLRWGAALLRVLVADVVCGLMVLVLYLPFWLGHSVASIRHTFTSPPSAKFAENSLLRAVSEWVKLHGLPARDSWAYTLVSLLGRHDVWSNINMVVLAG